MTHPDAVYGDCDHLHDPAAKCTVVLVELAYCPTCRIIQQPKEHMT